MMENYYKVTINEYKESTANIIFANNTIVDLYSAPDWTILDNTTEEKVEDNKTYTIFYDYSTEIIEENVLIEKLKVIFKDSKGLEFFNTELKRGSDFSD